MALVERDGDSHLTEAFSNHSLGSPSAAAASIGAVDAYTTFSQPYDAELPAAAILVAAEPSGAVGLSYRRYVKSTLLPGIRRVAAILRSHAATIEWPSWPGRRRSSRAGQAPSRRMATQYTGLVRLSACRTWGSWRRLGESAVDAMLP